MSSVINLPMKKEPNQSPEPTSGLIFDVRQKMDEGSLQSIAVFEALTQSQSRLDLFSYELYLQYGAPGRGLNHSITPCQFSIRRKDGTIEQSDGGFVLGSSVQLDQAKERCLIFTLVLCWTQERWLIRAWVEEEDISRDQSSVSLAEPAEFYASTVPHVIDSLKNATDYLEKSVAIPAIATRLAEMQNRPKA